MQILGAWECYQQVLRVNTSIKGTLHTLHKGTRKMHQIIVSCHMVHSGMSVKGHAEDAPPPTRNGRTNFRLLPLGMCI